MKKPIVVGFGYKAGCGKDTACDHIIATFPEIAIRKYGFADELRKEVNAAIFDRWVQDGEGEFSPDAAMRLLCRWAGVPFDESAPVSPEYPLGKQRALLQWWGTEYRRAQDPDYWVTMLAEQIERDAPDFALVKDVRFMNEFTFVCDAGYPVLLDRQDNQDLDALLPGDTGAHLSEIELDSVPLHKWAYCVSSASVDNLKRGVEQIFRDILGRATPRPKWSSARYMPALLGAK